LLKKNYLKYLYKFENLVPFEVLPLRLDAAIPALFPTEMLSRAASKSLAALDSISVEDFRQRFQHWERYWDCCIQSQGGVLRVGLKFQTCTNSLNIFLTIPGIFGSPHEFRDSLSHYRGVHSCKEQLSDLFVTSNI
jgi:hypothetical protein